MDVSLHFRNSFLIKSVIITQWLKALFVDFRIVSAESGTDRLL